ncbi:MAG: diguanylate cyclase [Deltaproteobacteria bacterium]|nr:diguanylate cyclase [Deltaproteobacteria bacterium]
MSGLPFACRNPAGGARWAPRIIRLDDPPTLAAGQGGEAEASRGRILLADDDRLTCDFVAEMLRRAGHDVEIVADGEAAIERAGRGGIDLALLDVLMPRINGLEACRIVKSLPGAGFLPVVLLTMRTDTSSRVEGLRVGADDYVCKPVDERELLSRVAAMLRIKRLNDQVAAAKARLDELSTHDEATGLFNFRHLTVRLGEEFKRSERYHDPLACLLIDVDGLKQWNDSHGRAVGDAIIRDTARAVRAAVREIDVVARYGGDEFLVILPSTHFAGALAAADRVWRDVRALSWSIDTRGRPVGRSGSAPPTAARITVSIGVSLFPSRDVRSKDQLLRAAEASLLRSKRDGGDRICVFQHQGYIYSPNTQGAPATPAPKPPSNSGIIAARRIEPPAEAKPPANVTSLDGRRGNRGE